MNKETLIIISVARLWLMYTLHISVDQDMYGFVEGCLKVTLSFNIGVVSKIQEVGNPPPHNALITPLF